jgi:hypothetical protein
MQLDVCFGSSVPILRVLLMNFSDRQIALLKTQKRQASCFVEMDELFMLSHHIHSDPFGPPKVLTKLVQIHIYICSVSHLCHFHYRREVAEGGSDILSGLEIK